MKPNQPTNGANNGPSQAQPRSQQQRDSAARKDAAWATRRNLNEAKQRFDLEHTTPLNRSTYAGGSKPKAAFSSQKTLKFIPLGGVGEIGRSMNILEYGNDAIVVDAGFKLGIDLPGINYALPDFTYLEKIKSKLRAYVFTHGHLDHIGAMPFLLSKYPAACYGSRFTLDMLERVMADRSADTHLDKRFLNAETHEKIVIGPFKIELVHVNHSIPDACAMVIDTPVGRIVHTGDFKFDPDPLDNKLSDKTRLKQLGDEGTLLLLSDSSNCEEPGHVASEKVLIPTIEGLMREAPGRVIISAVSTNINRIQMIIDVAVRLGRQVAIDGRSMLANIEMAVRNGFVRIPKGTIVAMRDSARVPDKKLTVISTGHQGELGSVLMRMASGEHKFIKLKNGDTVIFSASPIPGNEKAVVTVVDRLMREGATVYQHPTHDLDHIGPLHVSGHAKRDELVEMIQLIRPKYFIPIHGEYHHEVYHNKLAVENGLPKDRVFILDMGDVFEIAGPDSAAKTGTVPAGTQLVDQTGEVVPNLVIQDRLLMSQDGIVVVVLTLDGKSGATLSSPDIISRGFIHIRDSESLMNDLRQELRHFSVRRFGKVEINRFKQELRDDINGFLFQRTGRSPIIIPVINVLGQTGSARKVAPAAPAST